MGQAFLMGQSGGGMKVLGTEKELLAGATLPKGSFVSDPHSSTSIKSAILNTPLSRTYSTQLAGCCHLENDIFAIWEVSNTTCVVKVIKVTSYKSATTLASYTLALSAAPDTSDSHGGGAMAAYKSGSTWYILYTMGLASKLYLYSMTFTGSSLTLNASNTMSLSARSAVSANPYRTSYGFLVLTEGQYGEARITHWTVSSGSITKTFEQSVHAGSDGYTTTYCSCVPLGNNSFVVGVDCLAAGYKTYKVVMSSASSISITEVNNIINSNYRNGIWDEVSHIWAWIYKSNDVLRLHFYDSNLNKLVSYNGASNTTAMVQAIIRDRKFIVFTLSRSSTTVVDVWIHRLNEDNTITTRIHSYNASDIGYTTSDIMGNFTSAIAGENFGLILSKNQFFIIPISEFMEGEGGEYLGVLAENSVTGEYCKVIT